ncbi:MAG: hypothetical protein ACXAEX_17710 [Promethearchaeota archaeon]|jgi:hypothetical protein
MKEWKCVEVKSYLKVTSIIRAQQQEGWNLHSYSTAGCAGTIYHYLLFERDNGKVFEAGSSENSESEPNIQ